MKVAISEQSPVTKMLEIEVEPERYAKIIDKLIKEVGRDLQIPGFRKGKAPKKLIMRQVGPDALKHDLIEDLVPNIAPEIFKEYNLEPLDMRLATKISDIEFEEGKPLNFALEIQVKPTFELDGYKGLELIRIIRNVDVDKEVELQIKQLQEQHGMMETVEEDRPLQEEDIAYVDFESFLPDGTTIEGGKAEKYYMPLEKEAFIPGFIEKFFGKKAGEEWEFEIKFPDDYRNTQLAGKDVRFKVKLHSIMRKNLPARDDEFAKTVGKYETYEQLVQDLKARIVKNLENQQRYELEEQVLSQLCEKIKDVMIPPALIEYLSLIHI